MQGEILSRSASDDDIKRSYDRFSLLYGLIIEKFSRTARKKGIQMMNLTKGERVLEIGSGSGEDLITISDLVGEDGEVHGIDISQNMVRYARKMIEKTAFHQNVKLTRGDARTLPYEDECFDAIYTAETLELFEKEDIENVLSECDRVLKNQGKICVISSDKKASESSTVVQLYESVYEKCQLLNQFGCRPICVERVLEDAGFEILKISDVFSFCFPMPLRIIIAKK